MFYFRKTPKLLQLLFPEILWRGAGKDSIYLTFDDGPDPGSTPVLLDLLDKHEASATFFCLGKQVEKHPELFREIIRRGHEVGNHGYAHLSGWETPVVPYLDDVEQAAGLIPSPFFRPPYGRISWEQYQALKNNYQLVFWSRMPGDFDPKKDKNDMDRAAKQIHGNGEIIVLHDRPDCLDKTVHFLDRLFEMLQGTTFSAID